MIDEEIINQWKHERELAECVCSYFVDQVELSLVNETIDLINRQKAEIERLKNENMAKEAEYNDMLEQRNSVERYLETVKSEAVKEFAERLKEKSFKTLRNYGLTKDVVEVCDIDNLVKEMVGEKE